MNPAWVAAVVALALVPVCAGSAAAAPAATGTVSWVCESDGAFGPTALNVGLDTGLPGVLHVGEAADVAMTMTSALPGRTAKLAHDGAASKARSVEATITVDGLLGAQPIRHEVRVPSISLGDQSSPTAVPFTAVSTPVSYAPGSPEEVTLEATHLDATWTLRRADGSVAVVIQSSCRPGAGIGVVVDAAVVRSRSVTTVALGAPASVYGESVLATAAVSTTAGPVPGAMVFSIDGVAFKVPVGAGGVTTFALPRAPVGVHQVAATFLAADPTHHDASTSSSQTWTVAKAQTRLRVGVSAKRVRRRARVAVSLAGTYDTKPTGRVKLQLKQMKPRRSRRGISATLSRGRAVASLGKLGKGTYRLSVIYRGDSGHRRARKVKNFRVH